MSSLTILWITKCVGVAKIYNFNSHSYWFWNIFRLESNRSRASSSGCTLDTSAKFLRQVITWYLSWDLKELKWSAAGDERMAIVHVLQRGSEISPEEVIPWSSQTYSGPVDAVLGADYFLLCLSVEPIKLELLHVSI